MPRAEPARAAPAGAVLTVADAAARFGVSPATVLSWIAAGELRAVNVGRTAHAKRPRWRISLAALAAFEAARSVAPRPVARARRAKLGDVIPFYT